MADSRAKLHEVASCNLGKFGKDGVALKINFGPNAEQTQQGPLESMAFGLSREMARGLAKALISACDEANEASIPPTRN